VLLFWDPAPERFSRPADIGLADCTSVTSGFKATFKTLTMTEVRPQKHIARTIPAKSRKCQSNTQLLAWILLYNHDLHIVLWAS
jgi:hypothetical protein